MWVIEQIAVRARIQSFTAWHFEGDAVLAKRSRFGRGTIVHAEIEICKERQIPIVTREGISRGARDGKLVEQRWIY